MKGVTFRGWLVLLPLALILTACSGGSGSDHAGYGGGGYYKVGNPYKVAGRWYHPAEDPSYNRTGIASWYGPQFHGRQTANGERFNMNALTAAHTTLPMPSWVRVTNLENGRSIVLRVNDRGPFVGDRIIDVSRRGAQLLGFEKQGTTRVRVQVVAGPDAPAPVQMAAARRSSTQPQEAPKQAPKAASTSAPVPQRAQETVVAAPVDAVEIAGSIPGTASTGVSAASPVDTGTRWLAAEAGPDDRVYIQAGAFSAYKSARQVAEGLERLGRVELSPLSQGGQYIYRVRIGPLASMGEAGSLLGEVQALGHNAARIVVD